MRNCIILSVYCTLFSLDLTYKLFMFLTENNSLFPLTISTFGLFDHKISFDHFLANNNIRLQKEKEIKY